MSRTTITENRTDFRSSINFDELSWRQAQEMARAEDRSVSALIRMLVRQQYNKQRQQEAA